MRTRLYFSKRGPACFISHADIPTIFSRALKRAGIAMQFTEGFSPRPKLSLGPALPFGVLGLAEPAELWLEDFVNDISTITDKLNNVLPKGFCILEAKPVEGPSLAACCTAADYLIYVNKKLCAANLEAISPVLERDAADADALISIEKHEDCINLKIKDPDRYGPGKFIKALAAAGLISDWSNLFMVRTAVGVLENGRVIRC